MFAQRTSQELATSLSSLATQATLRAYKIGEASIHGIAAAAKAFLSGSPVPPEIMQSFPSHRQAVIAALHQAVENTSVAATANGALDNLLLIEGDLQAFHDILSGKKSGSSPPGKKIFIPGQKHQR